MNKHDQSIALHQCAGRLDALRIFLESNSLHGIVAGEQEHRIAKETAETITAIARELMNESVTSKYASKE